MLVQALKDPRTYLQAQDNHRILFTNILRADQTSNHVGVVSDLLFCLLNRIDAFAVAANQRGWNAPIFASRFDLSEISHLPVSHKLTDEDHKSLRKLSQKGPAVYKNPKYFVDHNQEMYVATIECCLSWFDGQAVERMKRFSRIYVEVEMLDMVARKANRSRLQWKKVEFELTGLGAQIFQHEYDHLSGLGIYSLREI